jgi:hypothetical protein
MVALVSLGGVAGAGERSIGDTKVLATVPSQGDTFVVLSGITGTIEITDGLCLPGDTPSCVGPYEAQAHITSATCSAAGELEGVQIPDGSSCQFDASAFMRPNVEGVTKPSCGSSYTFTSDHAEAFGTPVNALTIGGVARKISVSYNNTRVDGVILMTGWLDDDDVDSDPKGDHSSVIHFLLRPAVSPSSGPCVSTPVTRLDIQPSSFAVIFDR